MKEKQFFFYEKLRFLFNSVSYNNDLILDRVRSMSLWARTQQLTGHYLRQLQELYTLRFPIDVRHSIAEWLEAQDW